MATSRHLARVILLQSVFEWEFFKRKNTLEFYVKRGSKRSDLEKQTEDFVLAICHVIEEKLDTIKQMIQKFAPEWPVDKISSIDRGILYGGISEIIYKANVDVPAVVAINEAIEIAKDFGTDSSPKFVNGVLSHMYECIEKAGEYDKFSVQELEKMMLSYEA